MSGSLSAPRLGGVVAAATIMPRRDQIVADRAAQQTSGVQLLPSGLVATSSVHETVRRGGGFALLNRRCTTP